MFGAPTRCLELPDHLPPEWLKNCFLFTLEKLHLWGQNPQVSKDIFLSIENCLELGTDS